VGAFTPPPLNSYKGDAPEDTKFKPPSVDSYKGDAPEDKPGYWSQVLHNLGPSAVHLIQSTAPGPTASQVDPNAPAKPGYTEGPSLHNVWQSTKDAVSDTASDLWNKITNPKEFFKNNPAGALQTYGNLAAGGFQGAKALAESTPGKVMGAAVKAGAPDVAAGGAKVGAGVTAGMHSPVGLVLGVPEAISGVKQVASGFGKAIQGGREAMAVLDKIKAGVGDLTGRIPAPTDWDSVMDMYSGLKAPGVGGEAGALPAEDTSLLDGISRGMGGKSFSKLDANGQATVRQVAAKIAADHATGAAPTAAEPAPTATAPAPPAAAPVEAAPSTASGLQHFRVPLKARRMAQNLLDNIRSTQAATSAPSPTEVAPASTPVVEAPAAKANPYESAARTEKSSALAQFLYMGGHGITPEDAAMMSPDHWSMAAKGAGVKMPSPATVKQALGNLKQLWDMDSVAQQLKNSMQYPPQP
jgi:hypothetical protein